MGSQRPGLWVRRIRRMGVCWGNYISLDNISQQITEMESISHVNIIPALYTTNDFAQRGEVPACLLTDTTRIGGRRLSPSRVSHPEHRRSGMKWAHSATHLLLLAAALAVGLVQGAPVRVQRWLTSPQNPDRPRRSTAVADLGRTWLGYSRDGNRTECEGREPRAAVDRCDAAPELVT